MCEFSVSFDYHCKGCWLVYAKQYHSGIETYIGDLLMGEDGFWSYWPDDDMVGGFPRWLLMQIAEKIVELDAPMEKSLNDYFGEQNV